MTQWLEKIKKEFLFIKESVTNEVKTRLKQSSLQHQYKYPKDHGISALHTFTENFRRIQPDWKNIPSVFKKIDGKKIVLPKNFPSRTLSVTRAITHRNSNRDFGNPMNLEEISEILYFANGFKKFVDQDKYGIVCKTMIPSAGSRHSLEVYLILNNVTGIKNGVYHFDTENHMLEVISEESLEKYKILDLINGQKNLLNANFLFITSIHKRTTWKYGPRGYRFIHIEAGHLGQNIYLMGEAMGLSVSAIGGWKKRLTKEIFNIDEKEEISIYALAVGKK